MFNCDICKYNTIFKPNYTRHMKTKRHIDSKRIERVW